MDEFNLALDTTTFTHIKGIRRMALSQIWVMSSLFIIIYEKQMIMKLAHIPTR